MEEIQLRLDQEAYEESIAGSRRDLSETTDLTTHLPELALSTKPAWLFVSILLACGAVTFCHWFMLFVLDANSIFLRIITIVMPMLIGVFGTLQSREGLFPVITAGFSVAIISVIGMLGVTAWIDGVEWFPTNHRDQKEVLEYVLSIWLAFTTGFFIVTALKYLKIISKGTEELSDRSLVARGDSTIKVKAISGKLEGLIATLTPVVSAGAALYSGLKPFLE